MPFALRSGDASTLGGKAPSEFLTADTLPTSNTCPVELRVRQRIVDFEVSEECIPTSTFPGDILGIMENGSGQVVVLHFANGFTGTPKTLAVSVCLSTDCATRDTQELTGIAFKDAAAIARGKDGHPMISYNTSTSLSLIDCSTANCSRSSSYTLDQERGTVYRASSVILGADGNIFVAYQVDNGLTGTAYAVELRTAHCSDPDCSNKTITSHQSAGTILTFGLAPVSGTGSNPRVILGANNLPVIVYGYGQQARVQLAFCDELACPKVSFENITPGGTTASLWQDVALGPDGFLRAIYVNGNVDGGFRPSVVLCRDAICGATRGSRPTGKVLPDLATDGLEQRISPEIEISSDGQLHIAYSHNGIGLVYVGCRERLRTVEGTPRCENFIGGLDWVGAVVNPDASLTLDNRGTAHLLVTSDDRIIIADSRSVFDCTVFCGGLK